MIKCRVIDLFQVSWGTVAVLDFLIPTAFKLGDKLKNSKGDLWLVTGIAKSKSAIDEKYINLVNSVYVWDCTIKPINHSQFPIIGDELRLIKD